MALYKPITGRMVLAVTDPDVATTTIKAVPLSERSRVVARCELLAASTNTGTLRVGCSLVRGESTEARGEELGAGKRLVLPPTDLAWWYVTGDTAGDVVTWAGFEEVDRDGKPVTA